MKATVLEQVIIALIYRLVSIITAKMKVIDVWNPFNQPQGVIMIACDLYWKLVIWTLIIEAKKIFALV